MHDSEWMQAWRQLRKRKMSVIGLVIIICLVLAAAFAPVLAPQGPFTQNVSRANISQPPSFAHWLGTDRLGRDVYSRIVYGARISLQVGIIAEIVTLCIGIVIGSVAGYWGGWIDGALMRFTDMVFAFPTALFAIAVMAVFENPSVGKIILVLGFIGWPGVARLVRSQVMAVKEQEFAQAARAIGGSDLRIILCHIIPNSMAPILVVATIGVAGNILTESWLSFLGLGAQPPAPSWGSMITDGQADMLNKPWLCMFPGLAIVVTVLGFNLLGDGLRDALDPRLRQ